MTALVFKHAHELPEFMPNTVCRSFEVETHDGLTATVTVTVDLRAVAYTIGGKAMRSNGAKTRAIQGALYVTAANVQRKAKP